MCTDTSSVLRAVAADFFFNSWYLEIPSDNCISTNRGVSTILHKAFSWKRFRYLWSKLKSYTRVVFSDSIVELVFVGTYIIAESHCCSVMYILPSSVCNIFCFTVQKPWEVPCGGGIEYLHRSPASGKRRQKGIPVPRGISGPPCSWWM
jgi:hypothetical protein